MRTTQFYKTLKIKYQSLFFLKIISKYAKLCDKPHDFENISSFILKMHFGSLGVKSNIYNDLAKYNY